MAAEAAFASFEEKWLQANPEQATVAVFLPPGQRRLASAFGSLVHELEQAAFGVREPQVAAAKLDWWRQEFAALASGQARHPIARELQVHARGLDVDAALWTGLVDGALMLLDPPSIATTEDAFAALEVFYGPVAAVEQRLAGGDSARTGAASRLWSGSRLLSLAANLRRAPERAAYVPLDLLARHGLTRADIGAGSAAGTALLRDFLRELGDSLGRAFAEPTATLGRRVRARIDLRLAARAANSADPVAFLAEADYGRWRTVWLAWREARASAREG